MKAPKITRVVPNETWQLVIEFDQEECRLFDARTAKQEMHWPQRAYPNRFKNLTYTERSVIWPGIGELSASYLHRNSRPLAGEHLERQVLRLSYRNQAPTEIHSSHHVYCVHLFPFSLALFDVGESMGGWHGELGGSRRLDASALLAWLDWKQHFSLSGGEWAIPIIEAHGSEPARLADLLVGEICRREGQLPERN